MRVNKSKINLITLINSPEAIIFFNIRNLIGN